MAEFSFRHPFHEAGDGLALRASRHLTCHRAADRFVERGSAALRNGANNVALRKNTYDAVIGAEHEYRADALFCQQRHRGLHGRARFNGSDLTALGREYDTDGHCSLPTALARRYADGTCGVNDLNVCRAVPVPWILARCTL